MENFLKKSFYPSVLQLRNRRYLNTAGTVLIYVVVLMLIFGALGVVMVSMFTSSTASTVTRNDTRRAIYMAESGMRYAFSELRKDDFKESVIDTLIGTTYNVQNSGTFEYNIFSIWFRSPSDQNIAGGNLNLDIEEGEIPDDFSPIGNIFVVNVETADPSGVIPEDSPLSTALIQGYTKTGPKSLQLTLADDFIVYNKNRACLAVQPNANQNVSAGGTLDVHEDARFIFPSHSGAIFFKDQRYFYERAIHVEGSPGKIELTNLSDGLTVDSDNSDDFVILMPSNHLVIPTGTSDNVSYGGNINFAKNIYDPSIFRPNAILLGKYGYGESDIDSDRLTDNLSQQETSSAYFGVDTDADTLAIGGGGGGSDQFGSAFFDADMFIGGDQDFCQRGGCEFALGVRVFFLLDFDSQGDGITFTLTSFGPPLAPHNSATSVGGDIELSELVGYAGDSRLVPDPNPLNDLDYLASNDNDRGLDPPKIAVEFDTRTNSRIDDPPPDYCIDVNNINAFTRNDPLPDNTDITDNRDAVQYVFWGRTSFLNIPCRDNNTLYDDNRHDTDGEEPTEEWRFGMGGAPSVWRPAIGPDGTIYVSDQVSKLYAFNEDGTEKWPAPFNLGDGNAYMPGVDPVSGTIYTDVSGNALLALNPDKSEKWRLDIASDIDSTPIVGPDGTIYFGTDFVDSLFAVKDNGTDGEIKWQFQPVGGDDFNTVPALSPDATVVYAVSNDNFLYAVNTADGSERWRFPILTEPDEITSSPTVKQSDGTIYVGADDDYLYALKEVARQADPTGVGGVNALQGEWRFRTNGEIESSAAIDPDDGTIYIGSDDGNLWAINPNGTEKWRFATGGNVESSPIVDLDRTIYIGSWDGRVYAINPDGTQKWFFTTGDQVPSSPVLGQAGFIHIGSNDTNFYTISQFADPRNFKDENKTEGKLLTWEDLGVLASDLEDTDDWLNGQFGLKDQWAVRLEVDRSLIANAEGEFDYELSLWIRQCQVFDCSDITGTFFSDTRIDYENAPAAIPALPMIQQFRLNAAEHAEFERFFFGFTGATGAGQTQDATISQFDLSFIRPGDPVVDVSDDPDWSP